MKLRHIAIIGSLFPILFSLVLFFGVLISAEDDDGGSGYSSNYVGMNLSAEVLKHQPMTETFDRLYEASQNQQIFVDIMSVIMSDENIMLAYRNIKKNKGSNTKGTDKQTIQNIELMSEKEFVQKIKDMFCCYTPKPVKRVNIPKPNGKLRPLGIPTIWDRIIQQCVLQVLEGNKCRLP